RGWAWRVEFEHSNTSPPTGAGSGVVVRGGLLRAVSAALVLGAADDDRPMRALNNGHLVEGQGGAVAPDVLAGAAHAALGLMDHSLALRLAWRFSLQRFALCALLFRPCPQMSQIALQARARSVL